MRDAAYADCERRYDHAAVEGHPTEAGVTPGEASRVGSTDEVGGASSAAIQCESWCRAENPCCDDPVAAKSDPGQGLPSPIEERPASEAGTAGVSSAARVRRCEECGRPTRGPEETFCDDCWSVPEADAASRTERPSSSNAAKPHEWTGEGLCPACDVNAGGSCTCEQPAASRADYRVSVYFGATEDEFDALSDKVLDAVTQALGCTDDPEHECRHFQVGVAGPRSGGRVRALRWALDDVWKAVRYGEI